MTATLWDKKLVEVLRLYAEHEQEHRPAPTSMDVWAALGMQGSDFAVARRALLAGGFLQAAEQRRCSGNHLTACTLTAAGWSATGQKPPAPTSRGPRVRRCLGCGQQFGSWGAGNRLCPRCLSRAALAGGGGLAW